MPLWAFQTTHRLAYLLDIKVGSTPALWSLAAVSSAAAGQDAAHQAPMEVMSVSYDCPAPPTRPAVLSSDP